MGRKGYFLLAAVLFIPAILWYASDFTDLPEVTFQVADAIPESDGKVLVSGKILVERGVKSEGKGVTFYLQDEEGRVERIDYDGSAEVDVGEVELASEADVAGHMCGERFHAKNIYLKD